MLSGAAEPECVIVGLTRGADLSVSLRRRVLVALVSHPS